MKRIFSFVLILALFVNFSHIVFAQEEVPGMGEVPFGNEVQQGQQTYDQYTTAENKSDYLKQQWVKIFEKNKYIGPVVKAINSFFTFLSPFFKLVLGMESSLSWAFVFGLSIWLTLFFLINPITSQLTKSGLSGGLAAFAIASLIGLSGVIKKAVDLLTTAINNTWIAWISLAIAVIVIFSAGAVGKLIKKKMQKAKEQSEKEATEKAQRYTQAVGEVSKKRLEGMK